MMKLSKDKKRHIVDWILTIVLAIGTFLLGAIGYYHYAVFSQNLMSDAISDSEYYEIQYEKFEQELDLFLSAISVPREVVEQEQDLKEWYYFELRKKTLFEEQEGFFSKSIDQKIEVPVRNYLEENQIALSEEAELGFQNMLNALEEHLITDLKHPDITNWYANKAVFELQQGTIKMTAVVLVAGAVIVLFLIQYYWYRGFHYIGIGVVLGGILSIILMWIHYLTDYDMGIQPIHMNSVELFQKSICIQGSMIAAALIGIGIACLVIEKLVRGIEKRK